MSYSSHQLLNQHHHRHYCSCKYGPADGLCCHKGSAACKFRDSTEAGQQVPAGFCKVSSAGAVLMLCRRQGVSVPIPSQSSVSVSMVTSKPGLLWNRRSFIHFYHPQRPNLLNSLPQTTKAAAPALVPVSKTQQVCNILNADEGESISTHQRRAGRTATWHHQCWPCCCHTSRTLPTHMLCCWLSAGTTVIGSNTTPCRTDTMGGNTGCMF